MTWLSVFLRWYLWISKQVGRGWWKFILFSNIPSLWLSLSDSFNHSILNLISPWVWQHGLNRSMIQICVIVDLNTICHVLGNTNLEDCYKTSCYNSISVIRQLCDSKCFQALSMKPSLSSFLLRSWLTVPSLGRLISDYSQNVTNAICSGFHWQLLSGILVLS